MKIYKPLAINPGDREAIEEEEQMEDISFNVFKLNNRPKPEDPKQILFICSLGEFGCEMLATMYCVPQILQAYPGYYKIVVGWYGREYFYRHLVDEFWEIKEEFMSLREYARAFHHDSKNLKRLEKGLEKYGKVAAASSIGRIAVGNKCNDCKLFWGDTNYVKKCKCGSENLTRSLFADVPYWKNKAIRIPFPSEEKLAEADKYLKPNSVGVFARGRRCYGRNLQPEFYKNLISLLEELGYSPIWLGEKQTVQVCPVEHILDFSRMKESRDLETTLAIISKCALTVQFWTASTRLAGIMGTPYLLFESPDQIWGNGQEGFRRNLCDFGPSKLAICHFLNIYEDNAKGLDVTRKCIKEMEQGNYDDYVGAVQSKIAVEALKRVNTKRIGG